MTRLLRRESILERRTLVIERGAQHLDRFLDRLATRLRRTGVRELSVVSGAVKLGWLARERSCVLATHRMAPDVRAYISARAVGVHLEVLHLTALEPGFLKRTVATALSRGSWWSWSLPRGLAAEEELRVFLTLVGSSVDDVAHFYVRTIRGSSGVLGRQSTDVFDEWR